MRARWLPSAIGAALVAAIPVALAAQQTAVVESTRDGTGAELLSRPVTVHLSKTPLRDAVLAIARAAHVRLLFQTELLNAGPITLDATDRPLGEVFAQVLAGVALQAVPVGKDVISIEPTAPGARQVSSVITGVVTDASTKRPIAGASVRIDGTKLETQTKDDGTFRLAVPSAGQYKLVVRRLGYQVRSEPVEVVDGKSVMLPIALAAAPTALTEVVTTATGDRQRLEVGNAVGTIKADSVVATTLIRNVSDLLQARVPGVVVSNTDGAVGAPSKIRLRGVNSISLNNDPVIILDGVRLNAQSTVASIQTDVGSQQMLARQGTTNLGRTAPILAPSRLDDIDPNTIESIDVLRGPSASSLYGTDAANGVIVIKTKKGIAGSWRTTLTGDLGNSWIPGKMPDMWWGWGRYGNSLVNNQCTLAVGGISSDASGGCPQDSVTHFNPQNDPLMRTLGTGTTHALSGTLSGGVGSLQQFFSAHAADNVGMAKMSVAQSHLIARLWSSPAPSWMVHPNTEQDYDGSSRTTFQLSQRGDVSLSASGMYRNVLNGGSGISFTGYAGGGTGSSPADTLGFLPSDNQRTKISSVAKRGILTSTANYRPLSWMSMTGTGGGDYTLRTDGSDLRAQDCSVALQLTNNGSPACPSGHRTSRGEVFVATLNGGMQLSFHPTSWATLQTSVGEQYSHTNFYNLQVGNRDPYGCPLQFGTTLLTPTPVCSYSGSQVFAVSESRDEAASAGWYAEETVTLFGVYTTFGVRQDVSSAFGGQVTKSPPNYPKFNFSYPLSEKSFFPKQDWVSSLRLRLAYGQSGDQASQTAVRNNFTLRQLDPGGGASPVSSVVLTDAGNPNLRPEKGTEWEGGFDVSFLENERIHAEVTLYRKYTRDAITQLPIAPSYGVDNLMQYVNLGNVENRGAEVTLITKLIDSRAVSWSATINFTQNSNKLVHKAADLSANGPLNTQFVEGYPLFGYWGVPVVSYADVNGDSILAQDEIKFGSPTFMGAPYPKRQVVYQSGLSLFNGALGVNGSLNQIVGQTTPLQIDCSNVGCETYPRAAVDRSAPLAAQAGYIQAYVNNRSYLLSMSSVRLNELSVTYNVPASVAQRYLHVHSTSVTLAGRNLALWSDYAGKDPNVDTSGLFGDATQDSGLGTPQPRMFTFRINLGL